MLSRTDHLAGGLITTGIPGSELDIYTRRVLTTMRPSGVILFRRNFHDVEQLRALVADLHRLPGPPLVSIDHEGGRVMRLGPPFTHFAAAADIGCCDSPEVAEAVGRAMARELASVGIDIDFAPVLDVDSNPANPVIGDRSFGNDPDRVARLAVAFLRGMLGGGVLPCGKHFPGHGDTDRDSHSELPTVQRSRDALERIELAPFRAAIAASVPMLMTAHVVYPALDPASPATLSRPILSELLRGKLGFEGVIVSDDLQMKAIRDHLCLDDAVVAALQAGVDWLLIGNDLDAAASAATSIARALERGELERRGAAAAAARIASLRRRAPTQLPCSLPAPDHRALDERIRRTAAGLNQRSGPARV
jgi:beta-N-acetylhexosaminidase